MLTRAKQGIYKPKAYLASLILPKPASVREALTILEWKDAMKSKYDSLIANGTWDIVPLQKCL